MPEVNIRMEIWCDEHKAEARAKGVNLSAVGAMMFRPVLEKAIHSAENDDQAAALIAEASASAICCQLTDPERAEIYLLAPPTSGDEDQDAFMADEYIPGERVSKNDS